MSALQQRLSPLDFDFDVSPDEELPGYDASTAPAYDDGSYDEPLFIYHLRQYDRRIQIFVGYGAHATSSYRVTTNSFRLFSKKPEMEVLYTSPERRQRNIASIAFDNDGPLPWRPRAHFDYINPDGLATRHDLESVNFADWAITLRGRTYAWTLDMRPVSLVLCEKESSFIIARFTYSASGTSAIRGAEAGELSVYRDSLTLERHGVDKLICGLMIVLTHLKRMGRRTYCPSPNWTRSLADLARQHVEYSNGINGLELSRAGSLSTEHSSAHRVSSAGFSVV